jgi:hypothetical protein
LSKKPTNQIKYDQWGNPIGFNFKPVGIVKSNEIPEGAKYIMVNLNAQNVQEAIDENHFRFVINGNIQHRMPSLDVQPQLYAVIMEEE